jgi:hypothetical protein
MVGPTVGRINFNIFSMNPDDWKLWMDTTLHEFMHALGFNQQAFPLFLRASNG